MSPLPVTRFKAHDALAGRVQALLQARGLTFSQWMQRETEAAIRAGEISADVPGFGARPAAAERAVHIIVGDASLPAMAPAFARGIADVIRGLTITRGLDATQTVRIAPDAALTVSRKGKGLIVAVRLQSDAEATVKTLPLSMGLDLADMIRRAANAAQGLTEEEAAELEALGA